MSGNAQSAGSAAKQKNENVMKFKPEEKEKAPAKEPEWEEDARLCPECEGRGYIYFKDKRDIEVWGPKELCLTCDGLGVVYDDASR